jgi:hypothetical protein
MNRMMVAGIIVAIVGLACMGGSYYFLTQKGANVETPITEEVTKTREVPVQTQMPKTREVEKTKTIMVKENVPVFKEKIEDKITFEIQYNPGFERWTLTNYLFESGGPFKLVIKQPPSSKKGERRWYISFNGISTTSKEITNYTPFLIYENEYPNASLCYLKNWGDENCTKIENLDPHEYVIVFDPQKLENEEMKDRFAQQKTVKVTIFHTIDEMKGGTWEPYNFKSTDAPTMAYLELHLFDHYESKDVPKTITTKETETYYVTETIMKQETYTENVPVTTAGKKILNMSQRPHVVLLGAGIVLLIISVILVFLGTRSKAQTVQPTQQKTFCSHCGRENPPDNQFCTNCGQKL